MKKLILAVLAMIMMLSLLSVSISAAERPLATVQLGQPETLPPMTKLLTSGLTASPLYSEFAFSILTITDEKQLADIGDHFKYGVSMLNISGLERTLSGAVDGVWSNGNTGDVLESGKKAMGAASWYPAQELCNYLGETTGEGCVYQAIMTLNFGQKCWIDSFGYVTSSDKSTGLPQSADVYVSNNGNDWTLLGKYDRTTLRMEEKDVTHFMASELGNDLIGKEGTGRVVLFTPPEVTEAQFLRLAFTSAAGITTPADVNDYSTYSNPMTSSCAFRELLVFGSPTGNGTEVTTTEPAVTTTEEPSVTTTEEPNVTTTEEPVVTTTEEPNVTTTEEPIVTTTEPTGSGNTAEPNDTGDTAPKDTPKDTPKPTADDGGCGGVSLIAVFLCTAAVLPASIVLKKKLH